MWPQCVPWYHVRARDRAVQLLKYLTSLSITICIDMATFSVHLSILVKRVRISSNLERWRNACGRILLAFYLINLTCQRQPLTRHEFPATKSLPSQYTLFLSIHLSAFAINLSVRVEVPVFLQEWIPGTHQSQMLLNSAFKTHTTHSSYIETQYYSAVLVHFEPVCYFCGLGGEESLVDSDEIRELKSSYAAVYPICFLSQGGGKGTSL